MNLANPVKLTVLVLACFTLGLIVTACTETVTTTNTNTSTTAASPAPSASVDQFATARANFTKNCEPCHGPNGEGGLVKVEKKQIKVPSLKADHAKKHPDDKIAKMITNGEEEMPAFKDKMSQQEIADMVKFVRHQFQGQ